MGNSVSRSSKSSVFTASNDDSSHNNKVTSNSSNGGGVAVTLSERSDGTPRMLKSLHGNLMHAHQKEDPYEYYEVLELLGEGSMGSVSRVKKKLSFIGGSARPSYVKHRLDSMNRDGGGSIRNGSNKLSSKSSNQYVFLCFNTQQPCFLFCPINVHEKRHREQDLLQVLPKPRGSSSAVTTKDSSNSNNHVTSSEETPQNHHRHRRRRRTKSTHKNTEKEDELLNIRAEIREEFQELLEEEEEEGAVENGDVPKSSSPSKRRINKETPKRTHSKLITHIHKDIYYALKTIHLDRISSIDFMTELENEVSILQDLDHPNIVKAIETYRHYNNNQLYIVLELCSGGDLYTRDPYTEPQAKKIVNDMFSAIAYMHSRKITHRDLKYENIMFTNRDIKNNVVKLIDFGLSKKYAANSYLHDTVGTVYTMAPELLRGNYTSSVDVWSMGVIAFMLLSSSMPFFGKDRKHVIRKIMKGKYHFASRRWNTISKDAKKFIQFVLQRDPRYRPTAENALIHPWLKEANIDDDISVQNMSAKGAGSVLESKDGKQEDKEGEKVEGKPGDNEDDSPVMDEVQATIQAFADYDILKKLALMIVAYKSTDEEIGFLRQIFNKYDGLKDGEVSLQEFKTALDDYLYSDEEIERIFSGLDMDGTGVIHYSEFLAATIESHGSINEERLAEAFDRLDTDDSGFITVDDLKEFLGDDIPTAYLDEIIDAVDMDKDHQISYDDFLSMWDKRVDDQREKNKEQVRERRMRRVDSKNSSCSLSSMDSGFSSTDDELAGRFDFMKQKVKSVRSQQVLNNNQTVVVA